MDHPAESRAYHVAPDDCDRSELMLAGSLFLALHGACWFIAGALAAFWFLKG